VLFHYWFDAKKANLATAIPKRFLKTQPDRRACKNKPLKQKPTVSAV